MGQLLLSLLSRTKAPSSFLMFAIGVINCPHVQHKWFLRQRKPNTVLLHFRTALGSYLEKIRDRVIPAVDTFWGFFPLFIWMWKLWIPLAFPHQHYSVWFSCINSVTQHWELVGATQEHKWTKSLISRGLEPCPVSQAAHKASVKYY